jgi:hypothetical protein
MIFQGLALVCDNVLLETDHLLANLCIQLFDHAACLLVVCGNQVFLDLVPHILLNERGDGSGECSRHMIGNVRPHEKLFDFHRERIVDRFGNALGDLRPERRLDLVPSQALKGGYNRPLHLAIDGHLHHTGSGLGQLGRESLGQAILEVGVVLAVGVQGLLKPILCNGKCFGGQLLDSAIQKVFRTYDAL